jgi:molybdate transport system ATP-binding protein
MKARLAVALHAASVRRGDKWVLKDISWQLRPGERWALLGDNGAGKTQLLKLLAGDIWPTPTLKRRAGEPPERTFQLSGRTVDLRDAKSRMAYVGGERQDKYARYGWNLRVRELIATGLHRTDLLLSPITRLEAKRIDATLRACRLLALRRREFLSLSYGEKRLVLLARALAQDPDWLLLDEFYNGLDAGYRRRIDAVLAAARRRGQSWIATAHRAMDVPRGTRLSLELSGGRIHALKQLQDADFERMTARAAEQVPLTSRVAPRGPILLQLSDVDVYIEHRAVLKGVNWQLRRGEHWSIFGANGAGKSSFLKLIYGDLAPALGGRIERSGHPAGTSIFEWKRRIGLVSPELQGIYLVEVSILELVASGRHSSIGLSSAPTREDLKLARRWLKFFKLLSLTKRRPRELSYGQLRRALIARAMAGRPEILLLDEPLTGLDPGQRALMKRVLARLMRRQVTLIAAVHHVEDLPHGMTHGLHLHNRRALPVDCYFAT